MWTYLEAVILPTTEERGIVQNSSDASGWVHVTSLYQIERFQCS